MRWSDIPFHPPSKMLRQFAGLWLGVFGVMAAWRIIQHGPTAGSLALAAAAVLVGGLGLVRPQAVRPIFVGWMVLAFPIGWTVSHVLFGLLFFGLFTPLALAFRLAGRDALRLRRPAASDTYWMPRPTAANLRQYFRQF